MILSFSFPEIPPSINHIYAQVGPRRILKTVGKAYKKRLQQVLLHDHAREVEALLDEAGDDLFLLLSIDVYFPTLVNEGWLKINRSGKRGADSRYKRLDASNRVKVVEDAVVEAIGIDDSRFQAIVMKHMDPRRPRVEVSLEPLDPREFGVPTTYLEQGSPVSGARVVHP